MSKITSLVRHIQKNEAGQTLAALLRRWDKKLSWSQAEKMVRSRHVLVNGNLCCDAGRRLKQAEVIKLLPHSAAPGPKELDIRLHHVDAHVVVVEKPAGMTTTRHAEERNWPAKRRQIQPTLDEHLPRVLAKKQRGSQQTPNHGLPSIRAVHRLDRETSGLLVFARTHKAQTMLGAQFRAHTTGRKYLAVVLGHPEAQVIQSQLIRDRGDGRRGSTDQVGVGKQAITHIRPIEAIGKYSLIECQLETGRTHQIRIHLAEAGYPLCGERVYNKPLGAKPMEDHSGAPRTALHAAYLAFIHPASLEQVEFSMPLPKDLQDFVRRLQREAGGGNPGSGNEVT